MKKLFFTMACLLCLTANGQTYHPFPADSAIWHEVIIIPDNHNTVMVEPVSCGTTTFIQVGDTTFNNESYHVIRGGNGSYVGAYREDTTGKVWAVYGSFDTTEALLYDFSLSLGDTFHFDLSLNNEPYNSSQAMIVNQVDSIWIAGVYRKRLGFSTYPNEYWIEGIGSTQGWFSPLGRHDGNLEVLACLSFNDSSSYKWGHDLMRQNSWAGGQVYGADSCYCDGIVPVEAHESFSSAIKVYPNPSQGLVSIELPAELKAPTFKLYNNLGQLLKNQDATPTIDCSDLPSGMYSLVIEQKGIPLSTTKLQIE